MRGQARPLAPPGGAGYTPRVQRSRRAERPPAGAAAQASLVLDVVPLVMASIRGQIRAHRPAGLSLLQLQALFRVRRAAGCSPSELAGLLGLSRPTTSKLVDALVRRGLLERLASSRDRRRITVRLSSAGQRAVDDARRLVHGHLVDVLQGVPAERRRSVTHAMRALRPLFTQHRHREG